MMGILLIASIVMLFMGAWMPILSIGSGILLAYSLVVYLLILFTKEVSNKIVKYIIYFSVFAPIIWCVIDGQAKVDRGVRNVLKDFHYQI